MADQSTGTKKKMQKVKHRKVLEPFKPIDLTDEMCGKFVAVIYTLHQLSCYPGLGVETLCKPRSGKNVAGQEE